MRKNSLYTWDPMNDRMKEIECVVSGKVTGVMYRDFVQRKARAMWLTGTVENTKGKVKIVVQGPEEKLQKFMMHLHKGPFGARVRDVSVSWSEPVESYKDFVIVY